MCLTLCVHCGYSYVCMSFWRLFNSGMQMTVSHVVWQGQGTKGHNEIKSKKGFFQPPHPLINTHIRKHARTHSCRYLSYLHINHRISGWCAWLLQTVMKYLPPSCPSLQMCCSWFWKGVTSLTLCQKEKGIINHSPFSAFVVCAFLPALYISYIIFQWTIIQSVHGITWLSIGS